MSNYPPPFDSNNPQDQSSFGNPQNQGQPGYNPYGQNPMPQFPMQQELPNAVAILVLGITSIVLCVCYGFIGLACGIVALVLSNKALRLYKQAPESYTRASYNNVNAGRICAIIGTILSSIYLIFVIIYFVFLGHAISSGFSGFGNAYSGY